MKEETKAQIILLVEDDEDDSSLFKEALGKVSGKVDLLVAHDGRQAIAICETAEIIPDIVVLDYNMPGLNGLEITKVIRAMKKYDTAKVVILSTFHQSGKECLKYGADKCYIKPESLDHLIEIVQDIVEYAD